MDHGRQLKNRVKKIKLKERRVCEWMRAPVLLVDMGTTLGLVFGLAGVKRIQDGGAQHWSYGSRGRLCYGFQIKTHFLIFTDGEVEGDDVTVSRNMMKVAIIIGKRKDGLKIWNSDSDVTSFYGVASIRSILLGMGKRECRASVHLHLTPWFFVNSGMDPVVCLEAHNGYREARSFGREVKAHSRLSRQKPAPTTKDIILCIYEIGGLHQFIISLLKQLFF